MVLLVSGAGGIVKANGGTYNVSIVVGASEAKSADISKRAAVSIFLLVTALIMFFL